MPRQTEPSVNNVLGAVLQGMMRGCRVRSETVRTIVDQPGLQPDILITQSGRAPIVIEAEFDPARNVEGEASSRLGLEVVEGRRAVETVIALRYPDSVADADDLDPAVSDGRFSYCVLFAEPSGSRFPESAGCTARPATLPTSSGWCRYLRRRSTTRRTPWNGG